jgi:transposase
MTMTLRFAGCDVSRDHLDLHLPRRGGCLDRRLPNTLDGCAALIGALGGGVRLVVEASGGYEREIMAACHSAGVEVALVEAGRVRHFARARGQRAKTERIDAAVLAAFGAPTMPPPNRPAGPDIELLKALRLRRQTLVHRRMADLCQLKQARAPQIVALIEASRNRLGAASGVFQQNLRNPAVHAASDFASAASLLSARSALSRRCSAPKAAAAPRDLLLGAAS